MGNPSRPARHCLEVPRNIWDVCAALVRDPHCLDLERHWQAHGDPPAAVWLPRMRGSRECAPENHRVDARCSVRLECTPLNHCKTMHDLAMVQKRDRSVSMQLKRTFKAAAQSPMSWSWATRARRPGTNTQHKFENSWNQNSPKQKNRVY